MEPRTEKLGFIPCQKARSCTAVSQEPRESAGPGLFNYHSGGRLTDYSDYPNEGHCSGLRGESKDTLFPISDSRNATLFGERIMPIKLR